MSAISVTPHERWRLYTCSDCHPDYADAEDEPYETPYQVALPFVEVPDEDDPEAMYDPSIRETACPINNCPRCGGYLSLLAEDEVRVVRP
jgi:hypothetical protein